MTIIDIAKMRLDVSMLLGSCRRAFQGGSCSLAVTDIGGDANAAGHGIIFCLSVCVCMFAVVLVIIAGPARGKSPCQRAAQGETSHAKMSTSLKMKLR